MMNFSNYIESCEYLDCNSLSTLFDNYWDGLEVKFRKFEHLQYYNEGENSAMSDYINGNYKNFCKKLISNKEQEKPYYADVLSKGVSLERLHFIKYPITRYIEFEYYAYYINNALGERIYCKDYDKLSREKLYDFMIFDNNHLIINNYDISGNLLGGWKLKDNCKNIIDELIEWFDYQINSSYDFKTICKPKREILDNIL